jgi:hypothetical protein
VQGDQYHQQTPSEGTIWITIWQAQDPDNATPFDRKNNIGLHHWALLVDNHAALDSLHERLQQTADVEIEFAPDPRRLKQEGRSR